MIDLDLEFRPSQGGGGGGHGFYHASFRSGSRAGGTCALSAHDYIAREHAFDDPGRDRAVHVESGHMPSWAEGAPRDYWHAADLYERENGRLFIAGDFALPRGLELEEQIQLARQFVEELTGREHLPYTFAIHAGEDRDGHEHNPHIHVMISERRNDGIDRDRKDWFRRANRAHPERGGALKSRDFHGRHWVEQARERLADAINEQLERHGRAERVNHRSYERQAVDREPGEHFGPRAAHMIERGYKNDRLEHAADVEDAPKRLADLDRQIEQLERVREALARDSDVSGRKTTERQHSHGSGHSRDSSPER